MVGALRGRYETEMEKFQFQNGLEEIFKVISRANKYIDENMPWALAKDESKKERLGTVMYNLLEAIRFAAVELKPYLPDTADKIFAQLGIENKGVESLDSFDGMQAGQPVGEASILFERIDIPKKLAEIEEEKKAAEAEQKPAVEFLPDIPFDDFCKVDMTVCKVLACENVKKSSKLLKFQLDDGSGTPRQILSGIAKYYKPEELVGKTVVAVTNLPPRKMMGQESCGMLLSAERGDKLNLVMLDDKVPAGSRLV